MAGRWGVRATRPLTERVPTANDVATFEQYYVVPTDCARSQHYDTVTKLGEL